MNALLPDGLHHFVAACNWASSRYTDAARVVGDPGLRLQFKHLATVRSEMGVALCAAAGVSASYAATNDDDFPRVSPPPPTAGRIPLGGEEKNEPLSRDKLRALVRALREHDELMLGDVRRLRRETASNISATLDHVAATLASDLEKMRILENLTEEVAQPMRSR